MSEPLRRLGAVVLGVLAILGMRQAGHHYYHDFQVPHGSSAYHVPVEELSHLLLYLALGTVSWLSLSYAISGKGFAEAAERWSERLARHRRALAVAVGLGLFVTSWLVASEVLGHAAICDDEHVYRFIGQTLAEGGVTAPSPGHDLAFYWEQFVVLTDKARYGKYSIGYPLLLAAGRLLHVEPLVVPLITAVLAGPVLWIGDRVFGPKTAVLALLLLLGSPQVVLTGGTYLSQPLSALCLLIGLAFLLAAEEDGAFQRRQVLLLTAAGIALGYGVLVRPMPGALFVAIAAADVSWRRRGQGRAGGVALAALLTPAVLAVGVLLLVNRIQTGSATTSAYQRIHDFGPGVAGGLRFVEGGDIGQVTMSVAGGLLRLNAWSFGWPLGLFFTLWPRRGRGALLLIAVLGTEVLYRVVSPKTVVAGTGPVYLYECVPVLCLLTAGAFAQLVRAGRPLLGATASIGRIASLVVAGWVVNTTLFLPYKLEDLRVGALSQRRPLLMAADRGVHHALIFHRGTVPYTLRTSWAYFPPCNSPRLDDDILFLRLELSPENTLAPTLEFWRRRYPDRQAWYFGYIDDVPRFMPLEALAPLLEAVMPPPSSGGGQRGSVPAPTPTSSPR